MFVCMCFCMYDVCAFPFVAGFMPGFDWQSKIVNSALFGRHTCCRSYFELIYGQNVQAMQMV